MSDKSSIRAQIFKTHKPKSKVLMFFGAEIELRQPKLKDIISARENPDRQAAVVQALVDYAYVPGSDEKVFTFEDQDQLLELPFGGEFVEVSKALEELTDINFQSVNVN